MRRSNLLIFVFAGTLLIASGASTSFAQAPAGGGGSQGHSMQPAPNSQDQMNTGGNQPQSEKVDDKKFARDAAEGGMTEVELGKLALQKSSSDDVKQFAQRMIDDHGKAGDQLKTVATQENMELPGSLDSRHQSRIDKLSKLTGSQFDKAYVKDQLKDHEADVREFSSEAQNGSDPALKQFASSTLPVVQQHLELLKTLNKSKKEASE